MSDAVLVIEGRLRRWPSLLLAPLVAVALIGGAGVLLAGPRFPGPVRLLGPTLSFLGLIGLAILAALAFFALDAWELRRAARVELHPDEIVFLRQRATHARTTIAWRDLVGFDDTHPDRVELLAREGAHLPPELAAIPTPDDDSRVALLARLESHGLARV